MADVAQLAEHLFCKQAVRGSIPLVSSVVPTPSMDGTPLLPGGVLSQIRVTAGLGGVTEWLMVADCKSAGLTPYVGSNPTPTMETGAGHSRV